VSSSALALALAAAFLHAGWNVLLARANDVQAATAVVLGVSTIALAPIAAFTWDVDRGVVPWAVGSAAFELAYFALLAYAYERAAVSVVYPVARGLAPVLVLVVGIASASAGEAIGVVLVALGIVLVRGLHVVRACEEHVPAGVQERGGERKGERTRAHSSTIVTGPSFTSSSAIRAPNTPRATRTPSRSRASQKRS